MARVMVLGLDCVPPALAFGRYLGRMPNLARLMGGGSWGALRSSTPPITVPAWASMMSGRDAGELGLYGFHQHAHAADAGRLVTSADVREKRLWDLAGEQGRRVAALFVPPSAPPPPVAGLSAACFLRRDGAPWTFPNAAAAALERTHGPYLADVPKFRGRAPEALYADILSMTRQHFAIARDVWRSEGPDLLTMVTIGPDRFHHAFFAHMDPAHPAHDPRSPWVERAADYYAVLDEEVGRMADAAGTDTHLLVVSDHGARPLLGGVRVNQWLLDRGHLALRTNPGPDAPLLPEHVDWPRTRAFARGGYVGRVDLNVAGREPEGTVRADDASALLDELAHGLSAIAVPHGGPPHRVVRPRDIFRAVRGRAPDLFVFFGDLAYRALGTLGADGALFSPTNDRGADAANHDWHGVFVAHGPRVPARGEIHGAQIIDVASTVLGLMGLDAPRDLTGRDWSAP